MIKPSKTFKILAGLSAVALAAGGSAFGAEPAEAGDLNMLIWEGYADEDVTKAWEEATGCTITRTYVGSNDEFPAKLAAGAAPYDVITPSIDTTSIMRKAGFVEPIDISKLEHWDEIYEKFRNLDPQTTYEGEVWGMPYTWGSIPLMYRTDKVSGPLSFADLWTNEEVAGSISLWDDKTSLYITARMLYGKDINVYDMSDEQLGEVVAKLIELKPKLRKFWATAGELINLYANGDVVISNTWGGYQSAEVQKQGIDIVEYIPVENADGWQDDWQIVKGHSENPCVYQWLNFASGPEGQCGVVGVTGYSAANPVAIKECVSEERFLELHQDDPDYIDSLDFWREPARVDAYINAWNSVKAAQ